MGEGETQPITTPPPALLSYPQEILRSIYTVLDLSDLLAISLASRHLHVSVAPALYETVVLHRTTPIWSTQEAPLYLLLRTLLCRPDLANHVRHVTLSSPVSIFHPSAPLSRRLARALTAFVLRTGLPDASAWVAELITGNLNALAAALVALVPRARTVYVDGLFCYRAERLDTNFRAVLCASEASGHPAAPDMFRDLRDVSFCSEPPEYNLLGLFYLPRVERAHVDLGRADGFRWPTAQRPSLSHLRELILHIHDENILTHIIGPGMRLQSLRLTLRLSNGEATADLVNLDTIAAALLPVRETPTELHITMDMLSISRREIVRDRGSLGGLRDFPVLRDMTATAPFLQRNYLPDQATGMPTALPRALEKLTVYNGAGWGLSFFWKPEDIIAAARAWLGPMRADTPHLGQIDVSPGLGPERWSPSDWEALGRVVRGGDVIVNVGGVPAGTDPAKFTSIPISWV